MEETITRMVGTAEDPVTRRKAREAAARYLESTGCGILESNWECAAGAIDVICDDGGTVAFVEVVAGYGHLPAEDTSRRNQRRFEEIALGYRRGAQGASQVPQGSVQHLHVSIHPMSPVVGEGFGPPLSFPILQNLRAGIQLSRCRIILDATAIAVKLCF